MGRYGLITSTQNQRVVAAAKLHRRKERDATDRTLIEGPNAVAEALEAGVVETLFVTSEELGRHRDAATEVVEVEDHVLEKIAGTRTPQGVVAVARIDRPGLETVVGVGLLVVLDRVSDPGNAGTAIRTADAAGAAGVVLTAGSTDPWSPKAVRASAGSVVHLPVVTGPDLSEVAGACRAAGQRLVALDAGAGRDVYELEAETGPVALLFGNEAHGLPDRSRALVDATVAIPLFGRAESLNLAAAVAVTVYAAARTVHGHD